MIKLPEIIKPDTAYLANMEVLCEHAALLAQKVDLVDELDFVPSQETRSGAPTCQLARASGESVYLHSRYDPVKEAARWAKGVEQLAAEMADREDGRVPMCYFVDGFGLGYHVKALFEELAAPAFIVVSEPNVALLRTALEHFDYTEMFASDRLIVITTAERGEIFKKLEHHAHAMMMGVLFTQPLQRINQDFHTAMREYPEQSADVRSDRIDRYFAESF